MSLWSHAQTLTAVLPFSLAAPRGVREVVEELAIPGGGVLVLACSYLPRPAPLVIVLHGVSGSSQDAAVVRAARALVRAGFHVARLNQRGSGLGMGKAASLGHAGCAQDLALAVHALSLRSDVTSIGAVGFSLGGHTALTFAADAGDDHAQLAKLGAVAAVSAPVDLAESMGAFDALRAGGVTGVYEWRIVKSLRERARALPRFAQGPRIPAPAKPGRLSGGIALAEPTASHPGSTNDTGPFSLADLARVTTIREFDHVVTCPTHGFRDVADYHARASVGQHLHRIAVPTLVLHAADDPMVPVTALRALHEAQRTSRAIDVVIAATGGHTGFVQRPSHLWGANTAIARALDHFRMHLR